MFGSGLKNVDIVHRAGRESSNVDALSCNPSGSAPTEGLGESEVQVAIVGANSNVVDDMSVLLKLAPSNDDDIGPAVLAMEQKKDQHVAEVLSYIESGVLPGDKQRAHKIVSQANQFGIDNNVLYFIDPKRKSRRRAVVPTQLKES